MKEPIWTEERENPLEDSGRDRLFTPPTLSSFVPTFRSLVYPTLTPPTFPKDPGGAPGVRLYP